MAEAVVNLEDIDGNNPCFMVELDNDFVIHPNSLEFDIGRGKHCDLRIALPELADIHCSIYYRDHTWKIRNVGKTGTWLNGRVLFTSHPVTLNNSDVIKLGHAYIQCSFSIDKERYFAPIKVLKFIVLVGRDAVTLTSKTKPNGNDSFSPEKGFDGKDQESPSETDLCRDKQQRSYLEEMKKSHTFLMNRLKESYKEINNAHAEKRAVEMELVQLREQLKLATTTTPAYIQELLETELQCSICQELVVNATTLNCSHTFCEYCLFEWSKKSNNCPICRTVISSQNRSKVIDNLIEKVMLNSSDSIKEKRQELLDSRKDLGKKIEKKKPNKRRRVASPRRGGRQGITIALQTLANLMDTTIDISSDDEGQVLLFE